MRPPRKSNKQQLQPANYIKALNQTGGFLTYAAKKLGVTYVAVQKAIDNWPEVKEAYDSILENRLDLTEDKLTQAIKAKKPWAIQLMLKYKGRHRGYAEKQIIEADVNNKHELDLSNLSNKDLKAMRAIWEKGKKK
ncbi:MAG: hypothetical protein KAJ48_07975 [Elusimicrobiales bacterium]|nr:hypothetical protein [Elusimicrobiales bacterium]